MNYKLEGAMKKSRKTFIVALILWLFIVIVFVVPFSYSGFKASGHGSETFSIFFETLFTAIASPFGTLGKIFSEGATHNFFSTLFGFTIVFAIFFFIGFFKRAPKHQYSDIEHGSSDWSQHGEQYRVLSKNKGLILAENNYLPLDKIGNVNVMVVGRIRIW